jgi:tetratricopeptide (TPR) repeat protein
MAIVAASLAAACASSAPRTNPKAVKFQAEGARAYAQGDLDRAAGLFSLALEYDPRMAEARSGLGLVAFARGDSETAEKHFKEALSINEDLAEAHLNLGAIALQRGEDAAALTRFRQALAIDPGFGAARLSAGVALLNLGRAEEARWELAKLTEVEPRNARAHAVYAQVLIALGRIASAEAAAQKSLALDPNSSDGHRARAQILEKRKDFCGAGEEYRAVLRADPAAIDDRVSFVKSLLACEKMEDADAEIVSLEKLGPGRPEVSYLRSYIAIKKGDANTGLEYAVRALRLRKRYPEARMLMTEALFMLGRVEDGRRELRRFIDEAPPRLRPEVEKAKQFLERAP